MGLALTPCLTMGLALIPFLGMGLHFTPYAESGFLFLLQQNINIKIKEGISVAHMSVMVLLFL
jgi:hypothetical protein